MMSKDPDFHLDPEKYTIEEVAAKARKFLFDDKFLKLQDRPKADLSFYVGGYSSGAHTPERWLVRIESEKNESPAPQCIGTTLGLNWGGQPEAIYRLMMGISMNHAVALKNAGFDDAQINSISECLSKDLQAPFLHGAMPVQDAIDFADFLVETTKRFVRFLPGADTVGGDTDIAVVTKHEGFKWVRRKHYFNSALNPLAVC